MVFCNNVYEKGMVDIMGKDSEKVLEILSKRQLEQNTNHIHTNINDFKDIFKYRDEPTWYLKKLASGLKHMDYKTINDVSDELCKMLDLYYADLDGKH